MASAARRPEGFLRSNRREGAQRPSESMAPSIKQLTNNDLRQQTPRPPSSSRLVAQACLSELIGVPILARRQQAKYPKSLADRFREEDAPLREKQCFRLTEGINPHKRACIRLSSGKGRHSYAGRVMDSQFEAPRIAFGVYTGMKTQRISEGCSPRWTQTCEPPRQIKPRRSSPRQCGAAGPVITPAGEDHRGFDSSDDSAGRRRGLCAEPVYDARVLVPDLCGSQRSPD
jgi:hypothetical protein